MTSASSGATVDTMMPIDVGDEDAGVDNFPVGPGVVIVMSDSPMIRRIIL